MIILLQIIKVDIQPLSLYPFVNNGYYCSLYKDGKNCKLCFPVYPIIEIPELLETNMIVLEECYVCLDETTKHYTLKGYKLPNCNHIICYDCYYEIIIKKMCGAKCPMCRK